MNQVKVNEAQSSPSLRNAAAMGAPSHAEIAVRAYQLWLEQGRPPGSADRNWLEAEHELRVAAKSLSLIANVHERAGSVQN